MEEDSQRASAIWAVLILPFLIVAGVLSFHDRLSMVIVGLYWFPAIILVIIGTIPPPWEPLS
ncbi:MAG: hypothetical protein ACI9YT_002247 [Halobacteriales archaeon]|jgi:hypothetical protein